MTDLAKQVQERLAGREKAKAEERELRDAVTAELRSIREDASLTEEVRGYKSASLRKHLESGGSLADFPATWKALRLQWIQQEAMIAADPAAAGFPEL